MTKRYAILQKKLQELETELIQVLALPADTPYHQLLSDGIEQRFVFLNNLLSAEIASHPSKPHHLSHIAQRLAELETAFRDWDGYRTSGLNNFDTVSTCSCTESCLNDDGDQGLPDVGSPVYEAVAEEAAAAAAVKVEAERDVKREEEGRVWVGKYCGVMASGMMVGAALMMGFVMVIRFSGCFHYIEHQGFPTPT